MSKASLRVVDSERMHPRDIARQRVKEWRSDASKDNLPTVNVRDDKGAPALDVDAALERSTPDLLGKK